MGYDACFSSAKMYDVDNYEYKREINSPVKY